MKAPATINNSSNSNKPDAIIFYHIHKCGGNSVRDQLINLPGYKGRHIDNPRDWLMLRDDLRNGLRANLVLTGHQTWGIHQLLPDEYQYRYFTMLRNPFSLFLSFYRYRQSKALHSPESLVQYLQSYPHNRLLKAVALGSSEAAYERLQNEYHLFGILEQFEDTLRAFSSLFDQELSTITHNNQTTHTQQPSQHVTDLFMKMNAADLEYYDWALGQFKALCNKLRTSSDNRFNTIRLHKQKTNTSYPPPSAAQALHDSGNTQEAIQSLQQEIEERQVNTYYERQLLKHDYWRLSNWYSEVDQPVEAITWMKKAYRIDSKLCIQLSRLMARQNEIQAHSFLQEEFERYQGLQDQIVDSSLQRCLAPIQKELSRMQNQHPSN